MRVRGADMGASPVQQVAVHLAALPLAPWCSRYGRARLGGRGWEGAAAPPSFPSRSRRAASVRCCNTSCPVFTRKPWWMPGTQMASRGSTGLVHTPYGTPKEGPRAAAAAAGPNHTPRYPCSSRLSPAPRDGAVCPPVSASAASELPTAIISPPPPLSATQVRCNLIHSQMVSGAYALSLLPVRMPVGPRARGAGLDL